MQVDEAILRKVWHDSAILQIADKYRKKGYKVKLEERLGRGLRADIVAEKGKDKILIEVTAGKGDERGSTHIRKLKEFAERQDYRFVLAFVNPYRNKAIEIDGIEELLSAAVDDKLMAQAGHLATVVRQEDISDVEIEKIEVSNEAIEAIGDAIVTLELQFGSDKDVASDDGFCASESFPFHFRIKLSSDLKRVLDIQSLEIDASSYLG